MIIIIIIIYNNIVIIIIIIIIIITMVGDYRGCVGDHTLTTHITTPDQWSLWGSLCLSAKLVVFGVISCSSVLNF